MPERPSAEGGKSTVEQEQLNAAASGSLVVAVPTKSGLVFAADSRSTFTVGADSLYVDTTFKIRIPTLPYRTAIAVTGTTGFYPPFKLPIDRTALLATEPLLRLDTALEIWMSDRKDKGVSKSLIHDMMTHSYDALLQCGFDFANFRNESLCRIAVGSYRLDQKKSIIATWEISIDQTEHPQLGPLIWRDWGIKDPTEAQYFGATDFLNEFVIDSQSAQMLAERADAEVQAIWARKPIAEINKEAALRFANQIISATARQMEARPHRFAVGGPIDAVLLSVDPQPIHLQMKPVVDQRQS